MFIVSLFITDPRKQIVLFFSEMFESGAEGKNLIIPLRKVSPNLAPNISTKFTCEGFAALLQKCRFGAGFGDTFSKGILAIPLEKVFF